MKSINTILSIIFLVLSCMPCSDAKAASFEKTIITNQDDAQHDNDVCSPLCACNCCGAQGLSVNIIAEYNFLPVKILIEKKVPEYKSILISNFFGSIWQPPKLIGLA